VFGLLAVKGRRSVERHHAKGKETAMYGRRNVVIGLLAALALAGLAAAGAPQSYTLRLHQGKGDKATYAFTATSTEKVTGPGAPAGAVPSSAQLTCVVEFQGATSGGIGVRARITEGRVKAKVGKKSQTVPVKASSFSYVVTPRSEVKQSKWVSGSPPQISAAGLVFTADDAFLPPPLPDKPVKVASRWQSATRLPAPAGNLGGVREVKYDSTVLGPVAYAGRSCLKIKTSLRQSQHATMKAPDGKGTLTLRAQSTSEIVWLFDPKAGLVVKSDADGTTAVTRVTKTTGKKEQTSKVSGAIHTHARMTAYNGKELAAK
jgi:hypothetical protein